jgi:hypothetical protein
VAKGSYGVGRKTDNQNNRLVQCNRGKLQYSGESISLEFFCVLRALVAFRRRQQQRRSDDVIGDERKTQGLDMKLETAA